MGTPAIEIQGLTKDYPVGFWRKRNAPLARQSHAPGGGRRSLRISRAERRGKNDHAEAADGPDFSDARNGARSRPFDRRCAHAPRDRLPSRAALFLRLPHGPRAARLLRAVFRITALPNGASAWRDFSSAWALRPPANVQLRKFSKGMLQRAGIAQAILARSARWFFWTSRCPGSIRWAAAKCATSFWN